MSLKQKTISSLFWSIIENFSKTGIQFIIGIILARLLDPAQFGIIGLITVFIALSNSFVDSGFSQSLIRKQNCTETDYSTVFLFNISISFICYIAIFFLSPVIANFYDQQILVRLTRVYSIILILQSFSLIQRTTLTKDLDFKYQSKVTAISASTAGVVAIFMAIKGMGVWSLVFKQLFEQLMINFLLWKKKRWKFKFIFDVLIFREHFNFGYKLLISGLIYQVFNNIYTLMIGKVFSITILGFYSKAKNFANLPSLNATKIIQRVSYPVLSKMQDSNERLISGYTKLIKQSSYLVFIIMLGLAALSNNLILVLLGEQWLVTADYLRIICFASMLYPIHALNLNILQVKGRSDLFLKLEVIKKIITIITLVVGYFFGLKIMLYTGIFNSWLALFLNCYYSADLINYSFWNQLKDIFPNLVLSTLIFIITYLSKFIFAGNIYAGLSIQIAVFIISVISLSLLTKNESFYYILNILKEYKPKVFKKNAIQN